MSHNHNQLTARHVDGLVFRNNRVKVSNAFTANAADNPPVQLCECRDTKVECAGSAGAARERKRTDP
ncbi:MAG: hypothetical protein FJ224_10575 [Lentisphaerae bacterium]|nr:hypothetical protein [Lentisphaerota bacterium]